MSVETVSLVIPAYNEEKTLAQILDKVLKIEFHDQSKKEIVIVNDCSKDSTQKIAEDYASKHDFIKVINNEMNLGKSQSVRKGIVATTGDWVVIQDADLEYDPEDIVFLYEQMKRHGCDVSYGNRFGLDNGVIYLKNFLGNIFLSIVSNLFTMMRIRVFIPDMEVCYKMVRGDIMREVGATISAKSNFGFEPEITAKLSRYHINNDSRDHHLRFICLPIKFYPRTIEEGKKMKAFRDGFKALYEIVRYNLF
ncbi:MAG: glycosyltransferase family 2 protein [Patescibacteria group bacterium]